MRMFPLPSEARRARTGPWSGSIDAGGTGRSRRKLRVDDLRPSCIPTRSVVAGSMGGSSGRRGGVRTRKDQNDQLAARRLGREEELHLVVTTDLE